MSDTHYILSNNHIAGVLENVNTSWWLFAGWLFKCSDTQLLYINTYYSDRGYICPKVKYIHKPTEGTIKQTIK